MYSIGKSKHCSKLADSIACINKQGKAIKCLDDLSTFMNMEHEKQQTMFSVVWRSSMVSAPVGRSGLESRSAFRPGGGGELFAEQ